MTHTSLIRRAIGTVLLIEALCALAFISTALWHEGHTRLRALDVVIEGRADSLIGAVQDAEDPGDHVFVDPEEFTAPRGDFFAVFDDAGHLVGSSRPTIPMLRPSERDGFRNLRLAGHRYRVFQRHALRIIDREETHGAGLRRPITVIYAAGTDDLWHQIVAATSFYALLSLGLLCVTALALIWLLGRLLAPLRQLAVSASEISTDALRFEPPPSALGVRELMPLIEALSAMIGRVRAAFDSQHRFLHDAAHELKTAVAVVRSSIQVLSMRSRTMDEYQLGLNQILSDNERVEELVRQMLTLASFEERSASLHGESDLGNEVENAAENLRRVAEARALSLHCDVERGLAVRLSPEAVRSLASNLILNALQYSAAGGEVLVSVHGAADPRRAVLVVRDFGCGIAAQNLDRIFERFFREDPSRSRQSGGTGLGLSICKSIVDGAKGTIRVESEARKGTTVTVELAMPAAARPASSMAATAAPAQSRD